MKIHRLKRSKAMNSDMILGIVVAVVCLFVGLFAINMTSDIQSESDLKDYVYNETAFTVNQNATTASNATKGLNIITVVSIQGETTIKSLKVALYNPNTTNNMSYKIYRNKTGDIDHVLDSGTLTVGGQIIKSFTTENWATNEDYLIMVESNGSSDGAPKALLTLRFVNMTVKYPSSTANTGFGNIFDNLVTSTSTVYDVIFLVVIIVVLGIGLVVLRGMTGGSSGAVSPV